jgi:hypothetical protein
MADEPFNESAYDRVTRIINEPETINTIFDNVANGGSLIDLCELWSVSYVLILRWIYDEESRTKKYNQALESRNEWAVQRLLDEIRAVSFADIRLVLDAGGKVLPLDKWPTGVARAVAGLDINDGPDGSVVKKIKMYDKLKALEMLGRDLGRLIVRHEVNGKLTLEELVSGSNI